jgi:translocon-associated protein subunit gamma
MSTKKEPVAFTKEEELLLQDFSRNVSTKSSALFYGNAFIVSAIPICECRCYAYGRTAYA